MKEVTIICDPIGARVSVQYSLVSMVVKCFRDYDTVRVISPYIPLNQAGRLMNEGATKIQSLAHEIRFYDRIMCKLEGNESMLWGVSWMFSVRLPAFSVGPIGLATPRKADLISQVWCGGHQWGF